ncbi:peptidase E [Peribacillus kribbensis]|uniref:Type 1 glutamine amidotransferase-like domain-containing protein n=1 Tax=Peribacillus kribbensis TaxID=356658 RepID=UPI0006861623|nr:peptidase E [Peribacillus kribbensis]
MKQIIALGGGGFSMEPENPALDTYILNQCSKKTPKICFVGTASGDAESYIERFYQAYNAFDCIPSHLSLFKPPSGDLESYVMDKDIIFVGGGSTKNLVALWKEWGLDKILYKAWNEGIILSGISAGSICWFEEGVTDSYGDLTDIKALGFLPGSNCPHYDGEKDRRPVYTRMIKDQVLSPGYAADDGAALHFIGTDLHAAVSSRPDAKAYYVRPADGGFQEEEIAIKNLQP